MNELVKKAVSGSTNIKSIAKDPMASEKFFSVTQSTYKIPFNRSIALLIVFDKELITDVSGYSPIEIDDPFDQLVS